MEKKKGVGWAVMLSGECYLHFADRELADRRAAQVGGTVEEMFIFAEKQVSAKCPRCGVMPAHHSGMCDECYEKMVREGGT